MLNINDAKLPFICDGFPGIGGEIKVAPEHFQVEEIPLYDPCDEGEHLYVRISRSGCNTRDLQKRLARLFKLENSAVGCAGLKDKHALVTQTFSLWLPRRDAGEVAKQIAEQLCVEVPWARFHRNKLRTGHLLGNRFRILLSNPCAQALQFSEAIAAHLAEHGIPNYFGQQRFGKHGDNAQMGREVLAGGKKYPPWLKRLMISAYQSALFNAWLARRIAVGKFECLLQGDVAKKTDTGGLFTVENIEEEVPRFQKREITYTGPIFGSRMREAQEEAGELEREIIEGAQVTPKMFARVRARGNRRPARLFIEDLRIESDPQGLLFSFDLPKGAYATSVLREFVKTSEFQGV